MTQEIDFSQYHNPYDFAHPVIQSKLFSGRSQELKSIRYYLDEAKKAPRPMNLALLGPRASGKTSLLNMIEIDARKRSFCTVRVDLNEADVSSPASFFFKVFDSVLYAVCNFDISEDADSPQYPFGGVAGKTYQTYLDLTSTYNTNVDEKWNPFLFPLQYARAQASSVDLKRAQISDHLLKRDLELLNKETSRTICILFDECDCLTQNVELLEMLRNIFMNMPGYMLVFAGLPTLFPIMDDVFSPIIRQFKRIEVGPFIEEKDTEYCIFNPLESISVTPRTIIDRETQRDIYDLAAGKPYEINFICHFLFRRVQEGKASRMLLNEGVLQDVFRELEKEQDVSTRPVLTAIRNLDRNLLRDLSFFSRCVGRTDFEHLWAVEYVSRGEQKWNEENLRHALKRFVDDGILRLSESEIIDFAGDDFDRIYTKYYARSKEVAVNFADWPLEWYTRMRLKSLVSDVEKLVPFSEYPFIVFSEGNLSEIASLMGCSGTGDDIYVKDPPYLFDLFRIATDCQTGRQTQLVKLSFETSDYTVHSYFRVKSREKPSAVLQTVIHKLEDVSMRALSVRAQLTVTPAKIDFPAITDIVKALGATANRNFREQASRYHVMAMVFNYCEEKNIECALHHAKLAMEIGEVKEASELNNVGYLFMKTGDLSAGKKCFAKALEEENDAVSELLLYNYAVLESINGEQEHAITLLQQLQDRLSRSTQPEEVAECLLIPSTEPDKSDFEECWGLPIREATKLLESYTKGQSSATRENEDQS